MRVVMVSKALVVGIYQRKLEEIARLPGVELTAIVPSGWRDRRGTVTLDRAHTSGYHLVDAPLAFNGQYHFHFYPTLGGLLRALRPEVLHMDEEPYNLATWHALRLGHSVGAKSLFFTWQNLKRRYPWPFRYFEAANYHGAAYAIAGSDDAQRVLRAKGYRGPVAVIPQFGVDPWIFSPRPGADEEAPAGARSDADALPPQHQGDHERAPGFAIGYVGGLVPEKGVDVLLRACVGLPVPDWSLSIAGDGPERARLTDLAGALGLGDRVRFLGQMPSTETPDFYRQLDVLVLPSLNRPNWVEQFGRVLIEAMASGVVVAGSRSGEIPNVIGDAGLIFPEGDSASLRDALSGLAADPARRRALAAKGRARVLECFTQERIAAATYRVYCDMLGLGPGGQAAGRVCER